MKNTITFEELPPELQTYIVQPSEFDGWARAIVGHIAPAVERWREDYGSGGLAIWDAVRVVSWRRGVLLENLSREKFAKLVCTVAPVLGTPESLNASLKKSPASKKTIKDYDKLPKTDWLKHYGQRIDKLFDEAEKDIPTVASKKSHVDFLGELLCARVKPNSLMNQVKHNKIYAIDGGQSVQPAWSIETYQSRFDMEHELFSQVMAFEWVDGHVTLEILAMLLMRYQRLQPAGFKLVVVSIHGFASDVVKAAKDCHFSLTRLNPIADFNDALETVVRRTINNTETENRLAEALAGGQMSAQMLVYDGARLTTLADMMRSWGIAVNKKYVWNVPYYKKEQIRELADKVRDTLQQKPMQNIAMILACKYGTTHHDYAVSNLEELARALGLNIMMKAMPPGQYACLDLAENRIILSTRILCTPFNRPGTISHIIRFSIAHELGHFFLHANILREHIESFTETDASLSATPHGDEKVKRMEWQANYFAACLLMPQKNVCELFNLLLSEKERFLLETNKVIYEEQLGRRRLSTILERMSQRMEVSKQAIRIRLSELSLVPTSFEECA